ncbi:Hypothetical predicted protein [Lecanosticta acicola]|uniref:Uncharacterized protein n=1 Tax=Lecanosticta acicola TaxID=111012 RepID=A0AAI8W195_9PEZI|nr:Hypothetical predicted protein [Lecanosticta acicola]
MDVRNPGQYISASCARIPPAPCGGNVQTGMINAMYTMGGVIGSMTGPAGAAPASGSPSRPAVSSTYAAGGAAGSTSRPSSSGSASPAVYPGEAISKMGKSMALVVDAAIAVAVAIILISKR